MSAADTIRAPIWLAANFALVCGMGCIARRSFTTDSIPEQMQHTLVLCWACVVGVAIVLGTCGLLSATGFLTGVSTVALLGCWLSRRGNDRDECSARDEDSYWEQTPSASANINAWSIASHREVSRIESWCWFGWGVWAALCVGRLVVSGLLEFPSNWDTLTYHLPFVDQWLTSGSLYVPGAMKWFFPGNNELVVLWIVAPFSGDFFAPLNNVPAIALLVLSALQLARLFGVTTLTRHLGVLALMSNYVVWHQLMDNKNDVAVVSLFLASLVYAFRYAREARRSDLLFASICFGLLAGVKYYAVAYMGIALMAVLVLTACSRGVRHASVAAAVCLAGVLVWSGYWYGRNAYVTGSPFYPKTFFSNDSFETGAKSDFWSTTLLGNSNPTRYPLWFDALWRLTGPCQMACLLVAPWSMLWLLVSGWRRHRTPSGRIEGKLRWALALVTLVSGFLYAATPFTIEVSAGTLAMIRPGYVTIRLGLCFLSLIVLCAMILIHDWIPLPPWCLAGGETTNEPSSTEPPSRIRPNGFVPVAFLSLAVGAIGYQFLVEDRLHGASFVIDRKLDDHLVPSLEVAELLIVVGCLVFLSWRRRWLKRRTLCSMLAVSSFGLVALAAGLLGARWHAGFAMHYEQMFHTRVFHVLQEHNFTGTRICVLSARSYPFAGSRRQFLVLQAHPTAAQPRKFASRDALLRFFYDQRTELVAIPRRSTLWTQYQLDEWSGDHPGVFATLFEDNSFVLKQVDRKLLAEVLFFQRQPEAEENRSSPTYLASHKMRQRPIILFAITTERV